MFENIIMPPYLPIKLLIEHTHPFISVFDPLINTLLHKFKNVNIFDGSVKKVNKAEHGQFTKAVIYGFSQSSFSNLYLKYKRVQHRA